MSVFMISFLIVRALFAVVFWKIVKANDLFPAPFTEWRRMSVIEGELELSWNVISPLWQRYCERCYQEVEYTHKPGKVVLTFGNIPYRKEGRVFLLNNPDCERKSKSLEISEVYRDTTTCDRLRLERFITYILNYPPERGIQSVKIYYRADLEHLGGNLKNTLQNTFMCVTTV